jgi:hypothetical protein
MRFLPRPGRGRTLVRPRRRPAARRLQPELQPLEVRQLLASSDPFQPTPYEQYMLELINQARANPAAEGQRLLAQLQGNPILNQIVTNSGENLGQFLQVISSYGPEPPLAFNTGLIEAARDHSVAMLVTNNQFHSPAGYLTSSQVATSSSGQPFYPVGWGAWSTGENIFAYSNLVGGTDPTPYVDYLNAAFFLDWGNPDFGHLKNLLSPGPAEANQGAGGYPFSEIGIGLLSNVSPTVPPASNNPTAANQGMNVGPAIVTQEFGWRQGNAFLTGTFYVDSDNNHFYTPGEGLGAVTITAVGQNGQGVFRTQTWGSGGYSLQLPPGTYTVAATGNLPEPKLTTLTIGLDNVPWGVRFPRPVPADQPVPGNYSGTGTTSMAVYRAATGQWFIQGAAQPTTFGAANLDIPVPGDYDGTGHTEIAVYRPTTGQWFINGRAAAVNWGIPGLDIPEPGDYDGTGHTEIAVYRPSTAQWFIYGHSQPTSFGWAGVDIPVPGDYDGTGHTEIAVYRPLTAQWFISGHSQPKSFGWAGVDIPVPGDYDGTGHTEIAVYRPLTAQWYISGHSQPTSFGWAGVDVPVPGNYDGTGHTEIAVYRPSTAQWFHLSASGSRSAAFGQGGLTTSVMQWLSNAPLTPASPIATMAAKSVSAIGRPAALKVASAGTPGPKPIPSGARPRQPIPHPHPVPGASLAAAWLRRRLAVHDRPLKRSFPQW